MLSGLIIGVGEALRTEPGCYEAVSAEFEFPRVLGSGVHVHSDSFGTTTVTRHTNSLIRYISCMRNVKNYLSHLLKMMYGGHNLLLKAVTRRLKMLHLNSMNTYEHVHVVMAYCIYYR